MRNLFRLAPILLAAPILVQLFYDLNRDGQQQPTEPAAAEHSYSLTWSGEGLTLSSTGITNADGTIRQTEWSTGTWTVRSDCLTYTFTVTGDVAAQPLLNLPICGSLVYLPGVTK